MTLVISGPEALAAQGLVIPDRPSLVGLPQHRQLERYLTKVVQTIPELTQGVQIGTRFYKPMTPRPFQTRYGAMGAMRVANIFGYEAGAGKTLVAILALYARYGRKRFVGRRLRPGLIHIMAPAQSLELTWLKELTRCGLGDCVQIVRSEADLATVTAPILLYHYDFPKYQTARGNRMRREGRVRRRFVKGTWSEYFVGDQLWRVLRRQMRPHFLIVDEAHRFQIGTDRWQAYQHLRRGVPHVMELTGTPVDGWVNHLTSVLSLGCSEETPAFPFTYAGFTKTFTQASLTTLDYASGQYGGKTRRIIAPGVPQHLLPKFYGHVGHLMHRLLFEDDEVRDFVEYPEADYQVVTLEMSPRHRVLYDTTFANMRDELLLTRKLLAEGKISRLKARSTVLPLLTLLRQVCSHPWTFPGHEDLISVKLDRLLAAARDFKAQGRKLVVFTNFIPTGGRIMRALAEAGIKAHRIYANDPAEKPKNLSIDRRTERIIQFLDDDSTALVANAELLAESLTLSEAASGVLHFDHGWKGNIWEQCNKRVVRPGQVFDCVPVWDFMFLRTIETYGYHHVMQKLRANQRTVDRKFSSDAEAVGDALAILDQVLRTDVAA